MNFHLLAYSIYLPITFLITIWVGWMFYKNGYHYIIQFFEGAEDQAKALNQILLAGYYLLNLGYATIAIYYWPSINTYREVFESCAHSIALIILILAGMHFFNMIMIYMLSKSKTFIHQHKP